jgi:hypothetical protein
MTPNTTVDALVLDLLEWLASRDRSYEETMDAGGRRARGCRCGKKRTTEGSCRLIRDTASPQFG